MISLVKEMNNKISSPIILNLIHRYDHCEQIHNPKYIYIYYYASCNMLYIHVSNIYHMNI